MTSTDTLIADQVHQLDAGLPGQLPPDIAATLQGYREGLAATGVPAGVAAPGTELPDVPLLDAYGTATSLHEVTAGKPTVVVFYRGAWCPFCNIALRTYQKHLLPRLAERGVGLVAVSPQKPDGSLSMREKNDLSFPVVSDPGNALAGQLGILLPARPEAVAAAQAQLGLDLAAVNADGTDSLPMAAVAISDAANQLRWIDVHADFSARTEVADILDALDTLR